MKIKKRFNFLKRIISNSAKNIKKREDPGGEETFKMEKQKILKFSQKVKKSNSDKNLKSIIAMKL